jgi:hypothetical protein
VNTPSTAEPDRLETALLEAFPSDVELDRLLRSETLDKRFDRLASRREPLGDAVARIVLTASIQGWTLDLVEAAVARRPDVLVLRDVRDALRQVEPVPTVTPRGDRPSLACGRGDQWNEVCQCAPARVHNVIVVYGHADQDPIHFRQRIHFRLDVRPPRAIYVVDWGERVPTVRGQLQEALARALKTEPVRLRETLAARLAAQDLVLMHPPLHAGDSLEALLGYYTTDLPVLLASASGDNRLKCVQPIDWVNPPPGMLDRVGLGDDRSDRRGEAAGFVAELKDRAHPLLPIADLDELTNLTPKELATFAKFSGLPEGRQRRLLQSVAAVPQVSKAMFEAIDQYWSREVEAVS